MNDFIVETKPTPSTREVLPAGSYQATLYSIVDLGSQYSPNYDNRSRKVRFTFELPTELRVFKEDKGEQPMVISQEYTLSFGEKANLRKDLRAWRGYDITPEENEKGFSLTSLIGKPLLLTIGIKDGKDNRKFNQINGLSPLVKGMTATPMINKAQIFQLSDGTDSEIFKSLPEFIQKKIWECKELKKELVEEDLESEIPF